jgi:hypothetical protein
MQTLGFGEWAFEPNTSRSSYRYQGITLAQGPEMASATPAHAR